jgi:hypothetical protein
VATTPKVHSSVTSIDAAELAALATHRDEESFLLFANGLQIIGQFLFWVHYATSSR